MTCISAGPHGHSPRQVQRWQRSRRYRRYSTRQGYPDQQSDADRLRDQQGVHGGRWRILFRAGHADCVYAAVAGGPGGGWRAGGNQLSAEAHDEGVRRSSRSAGTAERLRGQADRLSARRRAVEPAAGTTRRRSRSSPRGDDILRRRFACRGACGGGRRAAQQSALHGRRWNARAVRRYRCRLIGVGRQRLCRRSRPEWTGPRL